MRDVTPDDAHRAIQAVSRLYDSIGSLLNEYGEKHSATSPAAAELKHFERPLSLKATYAHASLLIVVATDHHKAFMRTVTEGAETLAPWNCVRAVLESSALAAWLLDPGLDARTRVQRDLALLHKGYLEQEKFAKGWANGTSIGVAIRQTAEVERAAKDLGFRLMNQKDKCIGIEKGMPGFTAIVAETLGQDVHYRLLSAMVHAHPWAVQQLGFRTVQAHEYVVGGDESYSITARVLTQGMSPLSIAYLCRRSGDAFFVPVRNKFRLFGWDMERLGDIHRSFLGSFTIPSGLDSSQLDFGQ